MQQRQHSRGQAKWFKDSRISAPQKWREKWRFLSFEEAGWVQSHRDVWEKLWRWRYKAERAPQTQKANGRISGFAPQAAQGQTGSATALGKVSALPLFVAHTKPRPSAMHWTNHPSEPSARDRGTKRRNATPTTSRFSCWIWFLWGTLCKTSQTSRDSWEDLILVISHHVK